MANKEYIIIEENSSIKLENRINEWCSNGYIPDGPIVMGLSKYNDMAYLIFLQRMKKKPFTNPEDYGYENPKI